MRVVKIVSGYESIVSGCRIEWMKVEVEVEDAVELLIADAVLWKGSGLYLYFSASSKSSRCSRYSLLFTKTEHLESDQKQSKFDVWLHP